MAKNKLKNHIGQVSCVSYGLSWRRCFFINHQNLVLSKLEKKIKSIIIQAFLL